MALHPEILKELTKGSAADAWGVIVNSATEIASKPLAVGNAPSEVIKRDREIGALDNFLSASGWDLWSSFGDSVERTSDRLARWWAEPYSAKAVLILDGLSLRELPWLLQGAKERGFTLNLAEESLVPDCPNEKQVTVLVTVLGNLIENALDAMSGQSEGEVGLLLHYQNGWLSGEVSDDGPGIPPANIDAIFNKGFSTKGENRGVGLFLASQQLRELGGTLAVESEPGVFTQFFVHLPWDSKRKRA